jgi:hypothetical protein
MLAEYCNPTECVVVFGKFFFSFIATFANDTFIHGKQTRAVRAKLATLLLNPHTCG